MNSTAPDTIAEAVLNDVSRVQRESPSWHEAFRTHEEARRRRWDMLTARDLKRAAVRNVSSAMQCVRLGLSAQLVNERLRRARHDWRLAKEYEERAQA